MMVFTEHNSSLAFMGQKYVRDYDKRFSDKNRSIVEYD